MIRRTQYLSRSVSASMGCGGEIQAMRFQDDVLGDRPRRLQVLLQQGRRHRERFRGVVEPGSGRGVHREFPGRPDVDARQVTNRGVVLGITESPRQNPAGIARIAPRLVDAERLDPGDDLPAELGLGLSFRLRRRHRLRLELLEDGLPALMVLGDRIQRRVGTQVEVALALLLVVTLKAVRPEKRVDGVPKGGLERLSPDRVRRRHRRRLSGTRRMQGRGQSPGTSRGSHLADVTTDSPKVFRASST